MWNSLVRGDGSDVKNGARFCFVVSEVTGQRHSPREDWPLVIPVLTVFRANEYLCTSGGRAGEDPKILNPPRNLCTFQSCVYRRLFSRDKGILYFLTNLLPGGVALTLGHLFDCFASGQGCLKRAERRFFVQARGNRHPYNGEAPLLVFLEEVWQFDLADKF